MMIYQAVRKDASEHDKKLLDGHLFLFSGCKEDIWNLSKTDESIETIFGKPLIPKYTQDQKLRIFGKEFTIKEINPVEYEQQWVILYKMEDLRGRIFCFLDFQIDDSLDNTPCK